MPSVVTRDFIARAKERTWRGLTTATGTFASANAAAGDTSQPPVASSTTSCGFASRNLCTQAAMPTSSLVHVQLSLDGRTNTSNFFFATSMPIQVNASPSAPRFRREDLPLFPPLACKCGLSPKQPYGVFEENGPAPRTTLRPSWPRRIEAGCRAEANIQAAKPPSAAAASPAARRRRDWRSPRSSRPRGRTQGKPPSRPPRPAWKALEQRPGRGRLRQHRFDRDPRALGDWPEHVAGAGGPGQPLRDRIPPDA